MKNNIATQDWLRRATAPSRIEIIEAYFRGHGYQPHRHDTYAIGRTLSGVQSFRYRGSMRHGLPGSTLVLHPDELHDGEAGTEEGFRYRMLYVEPSLIQSILGGQSLPYIKGGISADPRLLAAATPLLCAVDAPLQPLEEDEALYGLAHALSAVGGLRFHRRAFDYPAAERARDYIHEFFYRSISSEELTAASGRERWALSRDFRALYGTSPHRYVILRRISYCKQLLLAGFSMADSAIQAGFTDQSHMIRHFNACIGLSPGRWLKLHGLSSHTCTNVQYAPPAAL